MDKMRLYCLIIIVLGCQTLSSIAKQFHFRLCDSKETIAVQLFTNYGISGGMCQCQTAPVQEPLPRDDYIHTRGIGAYKLHTDAKTWNEARKICNSEGAHLAIINSREEESILVNMLKNAERFIKGGLNAEEAHLGIHDLYQEGEWVTIFGEPLESTGYANWSPTYWGGQPDNFQGHQNCGALLNIGGMDDVYCLDKFAFFCELALPCQ